MVRTLRQFRFDAPKMALELVDGDCDVPHHGARAAQKSR